MPPVPAVMDEVGDHLISVASAAVHDIRRRTTQISNGVRSADRIALAGTPVTAPNTRLDSPGTTTVTAAGRQQPIIGTDLDDKGRDIEIDPADIVSVPLHDADGNTIGALFPSQPTDIEDFVPWARMRDRTSDLYYHVAYQQKTANQTGSKPVWAYGPRRETPWANEVRRTGVPPIYAISHANPGHFAAQLRTNGSLHTIWFGGQHHAGLVAANPYILRATDGNEFGTLVPVSCSPSRPGSSNGQSLANTLIDDADMERNIHVPTTLMLLPRNEAAGISWLGAEALISKPGLHLNEFESYWGSPYAFMDRH